ncbi:hypothetical protein [Chryseolinea soli]|uniref:hypothetical protein n=1 Tax=Chryseolinea soli TaxID=2321403 RepID=UPI00135BB5CF|nr:hypothetical protein [Chryseolinea soli]
MTALEIDTEFLQLIGRLHAGAGSIAEQKWTSNQIQLHCITWKQAPHKIAESGGVRMIIQKMNILVNENS